MPRVQSFADALWLQIFLLVATFAVALLRKIRRYKLSRLNKSTNKFICARFRAYFPLFLSKFYKLPKSTFSQDVRKVHFPGYKLSRKFANSRKFLPSALSKLIIIFGGRGVEKKWRNISHFCRTKLSSFGRNFVTFVLWTYDPSPAYPI